MRTAMSPSSVGETSRIASLALKNRVDIKLVFLEQSSMLPSMVILIVKLSKLQPRIGEFGIVEGKPQRPHGHWRKSPPRSRRLQMGIDQRDDGGSGHNQRRKRHGVVPEPDHSRYSAATGTKGAKGFAAFASMRSSITWRK